MALVHVLLCVALVRMVACIMIKKNPSFCAVSVPLKEKFTTGQNEREESTQNTTVTKSAAYASYKIKATTQHTYLLHTPARTKRRCHGATAHAAPPRNVPGPEAKAECRCNVPQEGLTYAHSRSAECSQGHALCYIHCRPNPCPALCTNRH